MKENKKLKIKLKTTITLIVILLIFIAVFAVLISKKEQKSGGIIFGNELGEQELDLSMKFLKLENNKKNMIFSPLSIKYALKILNEGSVGNTKVQIENVLGKQNVTKYSNTSQVMSLANGVYIRDTFYKEVKEDYIKTLNEKYNAEINYDSFNNANNINNWIEEKTLGIIKNMLRDETVQNPDNKMILINALAIDMEWEDSFDSKSTKGADFYMEDGSTINATTMYLKTYSDSISYYKNRDITALTMNLKSYYDTQLEFVAIMPDENLSDYIENFSTDKLDNIIEKSTLASKTRNGVYILIPRFSIDYNLELKNDLIELGITDAFDEKLADFSMISDRNLYVSDALHKANIDFTEKGIKAAATTVIYMTCEASIMEAKPVEININKPFLYVIRDKNTGEIWFLGTVYEPNSWEDDKINYQYR